jgi:hypothetical protein
LSLDRPGYITRTACKATGPVHYSTEERSSNVTDFANELVAEVFAQEEAETQACLRADLADLGAEEVARQFAEAEKILGRFLQSFEDDMCLYMVLSRAKSMATEARMRSEAYAAA